MSRFVRCSVILSLLISHTAAPCVSDEYLRAVREAVSRIELGSYDEAASFVERALTLDDSDPLGRTARAVVYLHTDRLSDAESEFRAVLAVKPDDWRTHYGLGVIALARKRPDEAEKHFTAALKSPDASNDLNALRLYLDFLRDGREDTDVPSGSASSLTGQVAAMAAIKSEDKDRAAFLLSEVLRAPAPPGFEENRAPLATFDARQPIVLPKGKLTWKPVERKDALPVSGTVTLKADAGRAAGVHFVMFYVDSILVGVTNYEPFQFDWDTRAYSNGLHHIRIEGKNQHGGVISSKSLWVRVSNDIPRKRVPRSGNEASNLADRLWRCVRVTESRKLAHYHLAKLCLEAGERENAICHLEYAVASEADFLDARKLLNSLRGWPLRYSEFSQGPPGSKMIALTIDDGPNERTVEMLEVLNALGVSATFFVVGFRAEAQPELVRAIQSAGHQIENHTYTHPRLTGLTSDEIEAELSKTSAVIRAITGQPSRYFRPPGGHSNEATRRAAARQGLMGVFWTINCSPFEGANYEALADHVISNATDGAIVLMHNGEPATTSALPTIVQALRNQGYRFVTISEMVAAKGGSVSDR